MEKHVCTEQNSIATIKEQIKTLFSHQDKDDKWKVRIEDKIDKILWFFLGQTFAVLASVAVYLITRR